MDPVWPVSWPVTGPICKLGADLSVDPPGLNKGCHKRSVKLQMSSQVVDSRDLAIFFNNKVFRNPLSNVLEKKTMEYFTEEGSYCKVCGFHSRRHIIRTNRGSTIIICLSCGDRIWKKRRLKSVPLVILPGNNSSK